MLGYSFSLTSISHEALLGILATAPSLSASRLSTNDLDNQMNGGSSHQQLVERWNNSMSRWHIDILYNSTAVYART